MIFASLVTPATTAIVVMGGVEYTMWREGRSTIMAIMFSVLAMYMITLQVCKQKTQLMFSKVLTGACAILMAAVLIGIGTQIRDEINANENKTILPPGITTTPSPDPEHGKTGVIGPYSVSTIYLCGMASIFVLAGVMHPKEFTALLQGVWYLLCLPAGYLILTMYSFANLDDRSWGTRDEQVAQKGDSVNVLYSFLHGCGLWKGESLLHFLGRVVTCRCQTTPEKDVENAHPYALMAEATDENALDNHVWQLSADASKAICKPVDDLLDFIAEHGAAESDAARQRQARNLTTLTTSALAACPSLMSRGQWTRCWDKENGAFKIPRGAPEVADKRT